MNERPTRVGEGALPRSHHLPHSKTKYMPFLLPLILCVTLTCPFKTVVCHHTRGWLQRGWTYNHINWKTIDASPIKWKFRRQKVYRRGKVVECTRNDDILWIIESLNLKMLQTRRFLPDVIFNVEIINVFINHFDKNATFIGTRGEDGWMWVLRGKCFRNGSVGANAWSENFCSWKCFMSVRTSRAFCENRPSSGFLSCRHFQETYRLI